MALPKQLSDWNRTEKNYPLNKPITNFIEEQVAATPDAPAVIFNDTVITYSELNRRANKLASHLRSKGIDTNTLVGVYMDRSIEMVVALLGITKAGGGYVPFDPEYPADRLAYMFGDSQVSIVITQRNIKSDLLPPTVQPIYLDDAHWSSTTPSDDINQQLVSGADDAVYMIYTSGSTGQPKGVVNTHKALVNRILWMQETFALTNKDKVLQKTPYSFDVSVWEFFWPLIAGASIVMARPGGHRDNDYLVDTIVSQGITTMHFVPSMLSLFLTQKSLNRIKDLRLVMCSGEALPFELTQRFFKYLPQTELHNLYGPTEAAIDVTHWSCTTDSTQNIVPIGTPIANIQTYILDNNLKPVAIGEEGELHLAGVGLAQGYWNRPELTAEKFIPNCFSNDPNSRMYKTGDLARYLPDGNIEYLGRLDNQVKLRGFRIELGEIEAALLKLTGIAEAVVVATNESLEERQLIAYLTTASSQEVNTSELRQQLLHKLPDYMVPARFIYIDKIPLTANGKVNRKALTNQQFKRPELSEMYVAPKSTYEKELCKIWSSLLKLDKVGIRDNFFDLGGDSLKAVRLAQDIQKQLKQTLPVVKIFEYGNIHKLAAYLENDGDNSNEVDAFNERATRMRIGRFSGNSNTEGVAVIGMVGRFPGAETIEELWTNLCNNVESVTTFGPDELDPFVDDEIRNDPNYVPTRGILKNADKFDAKFFGIGPLEAKIIDPQQRVFLELAWAALENAGYTSEGFPGMIGVYAGIGDNHYYTRNVLAHKDLIKTVGDLIVGYGNEKDYVATRVSYSLDLTGPSVSANTGCSTSLLAIDNAFKALMDYECDMALAGGVDIHTPQKTGQMFQEGGTFTKDGHCKPFDADATGTMFSDGAGIVVLKRLADALEDGDKIYSVIRSIAKNNDGANKVSFLAPSVQGQSRVIAMAHAQANITADSISYIEAHGTGTPLGDPIEIEGLTKAFQLTTNKKQFCHIGSIKGNLGHPTIASGVAGFIKVSLSLYHEKIPATLHFKNPNPRIDFEASPFHVVSELTPWPRTNTPRRAGVSSFGFGGTNVHGVLQEAPIQKPSSSTRDDQVLLFSAKTEKALSRILNNFSDYLKNSIDVNMADAAYTLQVGRKQFEYRKFVTCTNKESAIVALNAAKSLPTKKLTTLQPHLTFMFPGQGSQYINMGRDLYNSSKIFKTCVDECCDILAPHLDRDLRELLFPSAGDEDTATASLKDTYYTQPALFTIEYSLAKFWMSYGLKPQALVGHSIGEFVAACLAGVWSLTDALPLVALRGKLVRSLPGGSMLSVRCSADAIQDKLTEDIQLAAVNSPNLCVVAGPDAAINAFSATLETEGLVTRHLHTSHAFHSAMMDPIVDEFVDAVRKLKLSPPTLPIMSTCTGDWLTDEQATSPEYWGQHLRQPVLFSNAMAKLLEETDSVFLEVGPRDVLSTLARQQATSSQRNAIIASLANSGKDTAQNEWGDILSAVGALWVKGSSIDWKLFYATERRCRIPLPTYPFEPDSHWLAAGNYNAGIQPPVTELNSTTDAEEELTQNARGPQDTVMKAITQILSETVGIELAADEEATPFIMLGADSLVLMQMSRLITERLGLPVNFRQLLEAYASPILLADAVRKAQGNEPNAIMYNNSGSANKSALVDDSHTEKLHSISPSEARKAVLGRDSNNQLAWFIPSEGTDDNRQIQTSTLAESK